MPVPPWRRAQLAIANRLVFTKIRYRLGRQLEILFSGSAALSPQIAKWFATTGLSILEGYGLTQATASPSSTTSARCASARWGRRWPVPRFGPPRRRDPARGGKNIASTAIESAIKAACPLVSTAIVIADARKFASLLVTLDPDATRGMPAETSYAAVARAVAEVNPDSTGGRPSSSSASSPASSVWRPARSRLASRSSARSSPATTPT
ncbi:hypothetical protein WEI85_40895 [Actinomycetes bacterium KLBMP 9797]